MITLILKEKLRRLKISFLLCLNALRFSLFSRHYKSITHFLFQNQGSVAEAEETIAFFDSFLIGVHDKFFSS